MHAFYLETAGEVGARVRLERDEAKHAVKVLRLTDGASICALDGQGRRFDAALRLNDGVEAELLRALPDHEPSVRVTLYQGLPKADKLEWIAQKGTELGMAALVPVEMRYSVAKAGKDAGKHRERLTRIAREAVKQCRRAMPPVIEATQSFAGALEMMRGHELLLVPYENAMGRTIPMALTEAGDVRDVGVVIGPEGGIAPEELEALEAIGARTVTLGNRILRTETAALAALALTVRD